MKTPRLRVSLDFANSTDDKLENTAKAVDIHLYATPNFPAVPVTQAVLEAAVTAFADARAAQKQGGTLATAVKNNRREELIALLQQLAFYVQVTSANDLAILLSSGFEPVSTNRTQTQLDTPAVIRITSGMSGQLLATLSAVKNSRCVELQMAEIKPDGSPATFTSVGLFTNSRNIPADNLVPGKLYAFQGRAIGGLTGYSDWSDVVTHRAA
jgi:hypothetical protein